MDFINNVLHSIGFNWHVALANFINFLIILFLLNKFVFKKVFANMEERKTLIESGLQNATLAEDNLKKSAEQSQEIILNSKKEAEKVYKDIVDKAQIEASNLNTAAQVEADRLKADLNSKIANATEKAHEDFAKIAPDLLAKMFKKTLTNADDETHQKLIQSIAK